MTPIIQENPRELIPNGARCFDYARHRPYWNRLYRELWDENDSLRSALESAGREIERLMNELEKR